MSDPGRLFLVVGPSGVGKDSLLDAARNHFRHDAGTIFPRRVITRPAEAGGEDHCSVDDAMFTKQLKDGAFALHWVAYGLRYGVPVTVVNDLDAGRNVVVNVSRTVIEDARARFRHVTVLSVMADPEILAARLAGRQRSSDGNLTARLARGALMIPAGPDVVTIDNSGALDDAVSAFVSAIAG
ncbi:phosphonate metabolism protein/1,5-bisphosphokinase (PRPP-forming) PhnN [Alphaproteobacteria bacterium HT1-32]|nr:phosphonate metabolism protein/1,5-bisphosphokinase (PRPP-forming) PhnN [Alphaproteobacteria bacterium HT1-32]